jgi:pimeloyl-ACP methyl ester carboxylesterase
MAVNMATDRLIHLHGTDVWVRTLPGIPTALASQTPDVDTPVLLVHGVGSSLDTWGDVPERLSERGLPVIAVDLPGHGRSSKAPGDYSLGALASTLRDLLDHLGHERVHMVGHSLGGGITMQFAYQFPTRPASLVLVSSGGLGEEVFSGLRAAALPGADLALRLALNKRTLGGLDWVGERLTRIGIEPNTLTGGALKTVRRLSDMENRAAFLATVRSVINTKGQRVSALDKLSLINGERVMIIWGDKDPMIPHTHGENAHALLPGSQFVIFGDAGHEPHVSDPRRFTSLIIEHVTHQETFTAPISLQMTRHLDIRLK